MTTNIVDSKTSDRFDLISKWITTQVTIHHVVTFYLSYQLSAKKCALNIVFSGTFLRKKIIFSAVGNVSFYILEDTLKLSANANLSDSLEEGTEK